MLVKHNTNTNHAEDVAPVYCSYLFYL